MSSSAGEEATFTRQILVPLLLVVYMIPAANYSKKEVDFLSFSCYVQAGA